MAQLEMYESIDPIELLYEVVVRDAETGEEIYSHEYPSETEMLHGTRTRTIALGKYLKAQEQDRVRTDEEVVL